MTDLKDYLDKMEKELKNEREKRGYKLGREIAEDYFRAMRKYPPNFKVRKRGKSRGRPSNEEKVMETFLNFSMR